jgi:hypothetical protein
MLESTNVIGTVSNHHRVRRAVQDSKDLFLLRRRGSRKDSHKMRHGRKVFLGHLRQCGPRNTQRMLPCQLHHRRDIERSLVFVSLPQQSVAALQSHEGSICHTDASCNLASCEWVVSSDHDDSVIATPQLTQRLCSVWLDRIPQDKEATKLQVPFHLFSIHLIYGAITQLFRSKAEHPKARLGESGLQLVELLGCLSKSGL